MFATGETVDLAEWIIDDNCLVAKIIFKKCNVFVLVISHTTS